MLRGRESILISIPLLYSKISGVFYSLKVNFTVQNKMILSHYFIYLFIFSYSLKPNEYFYLKKKSKPNYTPEIISIHTFINLQVPSNISIPLKPTSYTVLFI